MIHGYNREKLHVDHFQELKGKKKDGKSIRRSVILHCLRGGGDQKILRSITWFSGGAEGDQLSPIEYEGGIEN